MIHTNKAAEEIEQKRLENIRKQIEAFEAGMIEAIHCPYCAGTNSPLREQFCCELFAKASIAVLERMRVEQSTAVVQKIAGRHRDN